MSDQMLVGRKALVTGSSRGIGRAIALKLAARGADLVIHFKKDQAAADEVVAAVQSMGRQAVAVAADLEDPQAIDALFVEVKKRFGQLDIFVSNAAATAFKPFMEIAPHNLDRNFAMNVRAFVLTVQRAAALMGEGGRIVAVSSFGSIRYHKNYSALGSAKADIESWVRYMAVELAPRGINVNAVCPGVIDTDSAAYYFNRPGSVPLDRTIAAIPKKRAGTPEDVAASVAFLVGPESDYILGETLVIDGGLTLLSPPFGLEEGDA